MTININDKDVTLKYSFRAMMIYENIANKSFEPKGVSEFIIFFYSTVMASDKELELTFNEFVEWLDEHPKELTNFIEWLKATIEKNNYLSTKVESGEGEKKS